MSLIPRFPRLYDTYRPGISSPFHESIPFGGLPLPPPPPPIFSNEIAPFVNAGIDWSETPEAHIFKAELPGLKKEEVKVEVDNNRLLRITGEKKVEKEEKNDKWHRVECSGARFVRCYGLPENARADKMKACMENGVLIVTIPKQNVKFN